MAYPVTPGSAAGRRRPGTGHPGPFHFHSYRTTTQAVTRTVAKQVPHKSSAQVGRKRGPAGRRVQRAAVV